MSRPVKREEPEGENEEERGRSLHTAPGYDGTSTKFDQYEKLVDAYRRLGKLNKVPNAEIALKLFSSLKVKHRIWLASWIWTRSKLTMV